MKATAACALILLAICLFQGNRVYSAVTLSEFHPLACLVMLPHSCDASANPMHAAWTLALQGQCKLGLPSLSNLFKERPGGC